MIKEQAKHNTSIKLAAREGPEQAQGSYLLCLSWRANVTKLVACKFPPRSCSFNVEFAVLAPCFMLVSLLAYSSTLTMKTICSLETVVDFHQTTQPYIPKDITLKSHVSLPFMIFWLGHYRS
jgi:hypothetical protein